jgi:hypothetical protein
MGPDTNGRLKHAIGDIQKQHTLQVAATLSYYFVLALIPGGAEVNAELAKTRKAEREEV